MISSQLGPDYRLLRASLGANAIFSILSGASMTLLAETIARFIGATVPPPLLISIGVVLICFGVFTAWVATRRHPPTLIALFISLADLSWIAASILVLAMTREQLNAAGVAVILAVATAVLSFALGQLQGLSRVYRAAGSGRGRIRVCIEIRAPGEADAIWRNVADLGNIARFAPMLATSSIRGDSAPDVGIVRECSDRGGRRWAERCVRLEASRRELAMEFLTNEPGFPFPFSALQGGWQIAPADGEVEVKIWWEGTLRHAGLAGVIPVLFAWQARSQFAGVVHRMARGDSSTETMLPARLSVVPC